MKMLTMILSIIIGAWQAIKFFFLKDRKKKKEAVDAVKDDDDSRSNLGWNRVNRIKKRQRL